MEHTPTPLTPPADGSPSAASKQQEGSSFTSSTPQLNFQFVNYGSVKSGVDNVIYIAQDTTSNKIDLQVMLNTGSSTLVQGDVVAPEQLPPAGQQTLLYLDLSSLQLTPDAWKLLAPAADGWNCVVYADDQVVGMAPSQGVTLQSGSPIAIHLSRLELDQAPPLQTPQLSVTYYNVPGLTSGNTSWTSSFSVAVQNPPSAKADLTQVLAVSLLSNLVVNSYGAKNPVKNTLTLEFSRTPQNVSVLAGPDTLFTLSFVYGKNGDTYGYGALTDVTDAQNIIPSKGDNTNEWVATSNIGAESPNWTLQPPENLPIVGSGAQAVVSWNLAPIVTTYQPGPTVMLVQYQNIPGYQDGVFSLVINKIPHVVIRSLSVNPSLTYFHNGQAQVMVSWEVDYATSLVLRQNFVPTDVTNKTSVPATLTTQTTAFSLQATGPGADVDNVDWANTQAIALPVINSFTGAPTEIFSGSSSHEIELYWAVDTTGKVDLTSTSGEISGGGFNAVDHTSATVKKPQLITLAPVTGPDVIGPTRNLLISAFTPSVHSYPVGADTSGAAASPSAPFLALVNAAGNEVIAVDTVQFSTITTVQVGQSPTGVAFSQDGSLMVTLNGDSTVSLHQVAISEGVPCFTSLSPVHLSGNAQAAVITPDASRVYLSVDGKPGALVALVKQQSGYDVGPQVTVGNAPRGLAIDPSGARLYIANSADDTISIVGIGLDGSLKLTGPVTGVSSQPTGLAITFNGATLLAACQESGTVWAIDTNNPGAGHRQQLNVGSNPVQVAVTPSGAYAFVANAGDGTVSLLDVWGGPLFCAVLQKAIPVGTKPSGVAVSPDGLVVLVSDSGSQNLGVISLQTYSLATVTDQVGNKPTDVVVSSDAKAALIWRNAMNDAPHVLGARYYPVASGDATSILTDVPIVECVFAPASPDRVTSNTAYAIGSEDSTLYVLDLSDPQNPQETDVDLPIEGRARGLTVSDDGLTLYVVMVDQSQQYTLLVGSVTDGNWSPAQSLPLYQGQLTGPVRMAVTPDGSHIFIADPVNHVFNIAVRGPDGQYVLAPLENPITDAGSVAVLPDGTKAYVLGRSSPNTITVIDVATLKPEPVSVMQSYVNLQELVPSPDGRRFYAPDLSAGALRILDPGSLRILQTLPLAPNISQAQGAAGAAIAPDGSRIFVVNTISTTMSVLQQISM